MTGRTVALANADRLAELADVYLDDRWTPELDAELHTLAAVPGRSREATWKQFEEYAALVRLRDDINAGTADWREVEPLLVGPEPSTEAYRIACGWVESAACVLLGACR